MIQKIDFGLRSCCSSIFLSRSYGKYSLCTALWLIFLKNFSFSVHKVKIFCYAHLFAVSAGSHFEIAWEFKFFMSLFHHVWFFKPGITCISSRSILNLLLLRILLHRKILNCFNFSLRPSAFYICFAFGLVLRLFAAFEGVLGEDGVSLLRRQLFIFLLHMTNRVHHWLRYRFTELLFHFWSFIELLGCKFF